MRAQQHARGQRRRQTFASPSTVRWSSAVDSTIELACTGVTHKARAALSGLSGRRHGRWCRIRAPSSARTSEPSDLFDPNVTQMYHIHLVEKAVLWSSFSAEGPRWLLRAYYGPELVWYGSADTHCIRYYRLHLTIRTYTTVLCGSKTHLAPACNATRVARCCSHHNRNCSLLVGTAAKYCVSRAQCRCSQPTDHVIITVGEPGHEENCDR